MVARVAPAVPLMSERDLRRQIDRAVARALVDRDYASLLLADPTLVLDDHDCHPQQYLSLRSIDANDLVEFARQAQALFWMATSMTFDSTPNPQLNQEEQRPLAALATR